MPPKRQNGRGDSRIDGLSSQPSTIAFPQTEDSKNTSRLTPAYIDGLIADGRRAKEIARRSEADAWQRVADVPRRALAPRKRALLAAIAAATDGRLDGRGFRAQIRRVLGGTDPAAKLLDLADEAAARAAAAQARGRVLGGAA